MEKDVVDAGTESGIFRVLVVAGVGLALAVGCGHQNRVSSVDVLNLKGERIDPFEASDAVVNLFLFTRSDCPISNRYAPRVRGLYARLAPRKVHFWLVYSDPDESVEAIQAHASTYEYPGEILRDREHELVRLTGVQVTPEVAVFNAAREMVYRGRIDDQYVDFGEFRAAPTQHDLEEAVEATLQGRPVANPRTAAVGCFISDLRR